MNYLNDPHYDVDEAQLDHFDQSVAKRQRYQLWKERLDQVELQIEKDEAAPDPDADSLLIGLQMMFSFMLAEDKTPLRMCDSCDTIFVANRKTQRYCCDKCRRKGE